jgi:FG-GAP repeat protein
LINIINRKSNENQCNNNPNREQTNSNYTNNGSTSIIPSNFKFKPFANKCFMICFSIFSILLPIGVQPQLESNFVFAEINSQSINDENENPDEGKNSSDSSAPESKLKMNVKNPFGSTDNNNKKVKMNIIIQDIVEPDYPRVQPSSTTNSDEMVTHSVNQVRPNSVDKSSSESDNADESVIVENEGKPTTTELSSIDSQMGTLNDNINKNINNDSIGLDDKGGTEISQSELGSQPKYKSYSDYAKSSSNNGQSTIDTDDKPGTLLSSTNAQIDSANSSIYNSTNEIANKTVIVSEEDQTTTTQSDSTTNSESQLNAQPRYNSYRDFMDHNNINLNNEQKAIENDYKPVTAFNHTESQIVSANNNSNVDARTKNNNLTIVAPEDRSITELSSTSSNTQVTAQSTNEVYGDFNGDGKDDLAIGVPDEGVVSNHAGAVNVIYGSSNGLSATSPVPDQFLTQSTTDVNDAPEANDNFGSSLSSGDFNGDGFDDLAIGVPGEDVDFRGVTISDAGAVNVIYGSSNGLSATSPRPDQFWTQSTTDVNDVSGKFDHFGSSLSSGDFNGDGKNDLAIGVPGEDVGSIDNNAGAVNVIYGSSNGLSATSPLPDQFWTQDSANVNDVSESNDDLGTSLSSGDFNDDGNDDLAIGVPREGVGSTFIAGAVNVIYGSSNGLSATSPLPDQFWTQSTTDVNDVSESEDTFGSSLSSGDFNDDGKDDLAIGVPGEDVGSIDLAGAVNVIYGSSNGLSATSPLPDQFWTQSTTDVNDVSEDGDGFGYSLSSGDFNGDGKDDLAIGVPFETVDTGGRSIFEPGAVNVIYGSSNGLSATSPRPDQFWTQDSANVNDLPEEGDDFGSSLSSGDFNGDGRADLAIGVPEESVGSVDHAGAVNVIYGSSNGLSATSPLPDQFWTQDSANVNDVSEFGDGFGRALG